MNKTWWKESVVYEIYPRSFCDSNGDGIGDLNGITGKLDYLKELGINVIWLAPVYKSPNDDNGYDIADYRAIMDEFGTMEDYDRLLSEAHKRDIRIVMDLVANHSSDEHAWFVESRSSKDNDKRDYYIWRDAVDGKEPTNWGSCFGGSAWEWDETTGQYYLHCFSKKQPDLNWDNPKVRNDIYDMMTYWLDKGIDGYRMDVIAMISKKAEFTDARVDDGLYGNTFLEVAYGPHLHEYIREMNEKVLSKYDIMTVGECGGATTEEAMKLANEDGSELSMVFQFEHVDLDGDERGKWCKKPFPLKEVKKNLSKWQKELDGKAWNSLFFGNHDQPRIVSRIGDDSPLSAKAVAVALYSMQGTPYLYQGEELGMTNYPFKSIEDYEDIESINGYHQLVNAGLRDEEELLEAIAYKSRDNARTPMQWSDEENAGFTTGKPWFSINPNYKEINATSQVNDPESVYHFYKKLIALRRESEWKDLLIYGKYDPVLLEDEHIFAYVRSMDDKKLLILCNLSAEEQNYKLSEDIIIEDHRNPLLLGNYHDTILYKEGKLRAWETGIFDLNQ